MTSQRRIAPGSSTSWPPLARGCLSPEPPAQALCAVANRLVNRIFSVLRSGRPYILRDHDGREISVAEAKTLIAERYNVLEAIRATRRANRASFAA